MGEKVLGIVAVASVLVRRFFLGWYTVEQKVDRLEEDDKDIRERLGRIEEKMSLLLCLQEGKTKQDLKAC